MSDRSPHRIEWIDRGREPQVAPDPAYPDGKDIVGARPGRRSCRIELPYPARRIGLYVITCDRCGLRTGVTTAGRPDDPRSVVVECKPDA